MAFMETFVVLLLIISLQMQHSCALHKEYYITATDAPVMDPCPVEACLTLSQFSDTWNIDGEEDSLNLTFQAGNHNLESSKLLLLEGLTTLTMTAATNSTPYSSVVVVCTNGTMFTVKDVDSFYVSGINFVDCSRNEVHSVNSLIIEDSSFVSQRDHSYTALKLINCSAHILRSDFKYFTKGLSHLDTYSRFMVGVGGAIYINKSRIQITESILQGNSAKGGGAIFTEDSMLLILNSVFVDNLARGNKHYYYKGGGALIACDTDVLISGSTFVNNSACTSCYGGAIHITTQNSRSVDHETVRVVNSSFVNNIANDGAAMYCHRNNIDIINCNFVNNTAKDDGGVLHIYTGHWHTNLVVNISHSTFNHNLAIWGGVVSTFNAIGDRIDIIVSDSKFINNEASKNGGIIRTGTANITMTKSVFMDNRAGQSGGIISNYVSNITVSQCLFERNSAGKRGGIIESVLNQVSIVESETFMNSVDKNGLGGVLYALQSNITLEKATFMSNTASYGGVMFVDHQTEVNSKHIIVINNSVDTDGGAFHFHRSAIRISSSIIANNTAGNNGGFMYTIRDKIFIENSTFECNSAGNDGGVIRAYLSSVNAFETTFVKAMAQDEGGVFHIEQSNLTIQSNDSTSMVDNKASTGSILWADGSKIYVNSARITGNRAKFGTINVIESTFHSLNVIFISNVGSLSAIESNVILFDNTITNMRTSRRPNVLSLKLEEGGAITTFQSKLTLGGNTDISSNQADNGAGIYATESKVFISGKIAVVNNSATNSGGGIRLYKSELSLRHGSLLTVKGNIAQYGRGGGIIATGSLIKIKLNQGNLANPFITLTENTAKEGGGVYLEMDSKVYILKSDAIKKSGNHISIDFTGNVAEHGGAVYVSDDGMCALHSVDSECFFQVLHLYHHPANAAHNKRLHNILFNNNIAITSGQSIYGGSLDRCRVNPLADPYYSNAANEHYLPLNSSDTSKPVKGLAYLQSISNIQNSDIGSPPVRVCFCRNGQPDCSFRPDPVSVRRGQLTEILISLAALDQINRPLDKSIIYNRLGSGDDLCQHHIQATDGKCNLITFTGSFNKTKEELILLTDGPCKEKMDSQARMTINAECSTCPIGFQLLQGEEGCRCGCDSNLLPHISNCSFSSSSLIRDKNIWITLVSTTNISGAPQYVIHPYCPRDYCRSFISKVEINLNLPNGADAQCANNRSGLLCGSCQPGLSLSLGSSHCIQCPLHWPVNTAIIVLGALLAGVVVVAIILVLNLTVALGTINAIIFYSNIFAISFSNSSSPSFTTVLISWLNLEAGLNVCFFEGMDAFWKILLQLSFPLYIAILVILIIIISEHSSKFSKLIGKRNPVATLATLILLSYNISLNTVITSLSLTVLEYPDDHHEIVWLADASVAYLRGKHIVLFITAFAILVLGIVYTLVLFFWQWILQHQDLVLLRWTRYHKLCHFIEPYHAPYSVKHRYWTGLLLLSRVILALVSAVNTSGDPRVTLVAVFFVIGCLLLAKGVIANRVYKNGLIDALETIVYFNILVTAALTWYALDTGKKQTDVTCASVVVMFAHLLGVTAFHIYKYTAVITVFKTSSLYKFVVENTHCQAKDIKHADG